MNVESLLPFSCENSNSTSRKQHQHSYIGDCNGALANTPAQAYSLRNKFGFYAEQTIFFAISLAKYLFYQYRFKFAELRSLGTEHFFCFFSKKEELQIWTNYLHRRYFGKLFRYIIVCLAKKPPSYLKVMPAHSY